MQRAKELDMELHSQTFQLVYPIPSFLPPNRNVRELHHPRALHEKNRLMGLRENILLKNFPHFDCINWRGETAKWSVMPRTVAFGKDTLYSQLNECFPVELTYLLHYLSSSLPKPVLHQGLLRDLRRGKKHLYFSRTVTGNCFSTVDAENSFSLQSLSRQWVQPPYHGVSICLELWLWHGTSSICDRIHLMNGII